MRELLDLEQQQTTPSGLTAEAAVETEAPHRSKEEQAFIDECLEDLR